mgnify:CR=1 FL=1
MDYRGSRERVSAVTERKGAVSLFVMLSAFAESGHSIEVLSKHNLTGAGFSVILLFSVC